MSLDLIEQDSVARPLAARDPGHEHTPELAERTRARLLATTRSNWLHGGRDGLVARGDYAAAG